MPKILQKQEELKNFKLVKVNIDKNPDLAEKLAVDRIPYVLTVYKGNIISNFQGVPRPDEFDKYFESITLLADLGQNEDVIKALIKGADDWMNQKQYDRAENMFKEGMSHQKWDKDYGYIFRAGLGRYVYIKTSFVRL